MLQLENPDNALQVSQAIDEQFANSPYETTTETELAFLSSFAKQFGNIQMILMTIGAVVFFTLLLVTGSTMSMAIRERTAEIGVLKTLGFSDLVVLFLVLSESIAYALVGGGVGIGLVKLYTMSGDPTGGLMPKFHFSQAGIVVGLLITLLIGVLSGIIPAINAMRLTIINALRRV